VTQALSREEGRALLIAPKQHKYRARAVWVDGLHFASKREAKRWCELKTMAGLGKIKNLRRQVSFPLHVSGKKITSYRADFVYEAENGALIVEDAKGIELELFRIKAKWIKAEYGIEVRKV